MITFQSVTAELTSFRNENSLVVCLVTCVACWKPSEVFMRGIISTMFVLCNISHSKNCNSLIGLIYI